MTTNTTPAVSKRRTSQFYIEVPPSPVALSEYKPLSSCSINRSQRALKENMLALPHNNDTPLLHTALKRKPPLNDDAPPVKKVKEQQHHAEDDIVLSGNDTNGYPNGCPKCRDICNCARRRKLKGLKPTGVSRKADASSVVHILKENPNEAKTKSETKGKSILQPDRKNASKHLSTTKIPAPIWKRLCVPLDLRAIEDRIYIREFMLRFGKAMVPAISRNHLRELESVGGGLRGRDDFEDMPSWVSESCIKSMILGLLGFLVTDCRKVEAINSSMKDIRATGGNLNKLWNALQALRIVPERTVCHEQLCLTFPDPLPPPASATVYQTRSTRNANTGQRSVNIICSGQMVPVLTALIDLSLATKAIRETIETGLKEVKEFSQKSKEAIKLENERWTNSRKVLETKKVEKERSLALGQHKLLREKHKQRLLEINNSLEIVSSNYPGRFQGLLGKDREGRAYWTTSPGIEEIVAAHEFLTAATSDRSNDESGSSKKKKKDQISLEVQPRNSKEWPWFVAVWGQAPPGWEENNSESSDDENTRDTWWIFDEVDEIRKLANWLGERDEVNDQKGDLDTLPRRLIDFANLLEWRGRVDRSATPLN